MNWFTDARRAARHEKSLEAVKVVIFQRGAHSQSSFANDTRSSWAAIKNVCSYHCWTARHYLIRVVAGGALNRGKQGLSGGYLTLSPGEIGLKMIRGGSVLPPSLISPRPSILFSDISSRWKMFTIRAQRAGERGCPL